MYRLSKLTNMNMNAFNGKTDPLVDDIVNGVLSMDHCELALTEGRESSEAKAAFKSLPKWPNHQLLGHLPVPNLNQTIDRWFEVVRALGSANDLAEFQRLIPKFRKFEGPRLQKLLQKRAENMENWLQDIWMRKKYLEERVPLPIHVNPAILFPFKCFEPGERNQIEFVAKLLVAVSEFRDMVKNRVLPIEKIGKSTTLDMSQYDWLFGGYRIPGAKRDRLKLWPHSDHFMVVRNGHFSSVPFDDNSYRAFKENLEEVLDHSQTYAEFPIGAFTAENRTVWADIYSKLEENTDNKKFFDKLEKAAFLVCLDRGSSTSWGDLGHQLLHGKGPEADGANRWYGKTLQFVINTTGSAGILYEHSPVEGLPIAALMDYVLKRIRQMQDNVSKERKLSIFSTENVQKFHLHLTKDQEVSLKKALENLSDLASDFESEAFTFHDFGKNFAKSVSMSPDSFVQVAIQLAYYRLHRELAAQYETGTLRQFKSGRTDTIRLPTSESVDFVKSFGARDSVQPAVKAQLLRKAVASHKEYALLACSGNGIDRHLLGLQRMAEYNRLETPAILKSNAYQNMMYFKLSTSQLPCKEELVMTYGPEVPDGYGVCYNPRENAILFAVTALKSCPGTNAEKFGVMLQDCLRYMKKLCLTNGLVQNGV